MSGILRVFLPAGKPGTVQSKSALASGVKLTFKAVFLPHLRLWDSPFGMVFGGLKRFFDLGLLPSQIAGISRFRLFRGQFR